MSVFFTELNCPSETCFGLSDASHLSGQALCVQIQWVSSLSIVVFLVVCFFVAVLFCLTFWKQRGEVIRID